MDVFATIGYITGAIGLISTAAIAYFVVKSGATKTTISTQNELIDTLIKSKNEQKEQIIELQGQYKDAKSTLDRMKGEIDTIKTIPLKEISTDLKQITAEQKLLNGCIADATKQHGVIIGLLEAKA